MKLRNREFKNQTMLVCSVALGILLFSFNTQAQQTEQDSVTYQSQTTTTTTQSVDVDADYDNQDQPERRHDSAAPRAGIKGGLNWSNLIVDDVNTRHDKFGFHVGVYGQLFASPAFTIQPEVNFSTKGNRIETNVGVIDQEYKFNLSYIDIPVLAVFKLGRVAEIHVGPYWSYLVGANIDRDGDVTDTFNRVDRDNFEKWDYGLAGGLGFNLGKGAQLGARYNYGMKDIAKSNGARMMLGDTKNSVGQIYLAFNLAAGND
jgi:hypothetical protein